MLVIELPDFPETSSPWTGVRVTVGFDGGLVAVDVSRSVNTSNEAYLVRGSDASLVVTDHFLTALRHCPPDQRDPSPDALIDHFLYRNLSGEMTYARGVIRAGHGRTVRWEARSDKLRIVRRQTLKRPPARGFAEALDLLECSLDDVMAAIVRAAPAGAATNLLSGGVDSTLLQVLLPRGSPALSFGIDTPEFSPELERASAASKLTGSNHQVIHLREGDYLESLERFVTTVGLPPHHLQSVLLGELFGQVGGNKSFLLTAQLADALFGLGFATRTAILRRWGWLVQCIGRSWLPAGLKPGRLRTAEVIGAALRRPVSSTRGVAARLACYTDFDFVERVFGVREVEERLQKRLQYIFDLCPFLSPDAHGSDAHLEAGHMVDYFCDDAVSIWRQSAMSYGGFLIGPFTHPTIVQCSLSFPIRDRYWRRGESKPALKRLLRRRLPEYDTRLPKLATGLPIQRFLESGPLRHCRHSTPPDFFPQPEKLSGGAYPPWIAWSILTLSAWRNLACQPVATPPLAFSRTILVSGVHSP
jgi:asparagine synthase (glutamine-hydrolysing)